MSYSQDEGYLPLSFTEIMNFIREGVNAQFNTSYTAESFVGTNWYKYHYPLVQKILANETKTAEVFHKVQQYIRTTNEKIQRPSVSMPGLLDSFAAKGYIASVKPPVEEDAGTISICVDVDNGADDYDAKKLEIGTLIKDFIAGGIVSLGTEEQAVTLSNGQSFTFKYFLPTPKPILLRAFLVKSNNSLLPVPTDEEVRQEIFENIRARYRLGWDFAPQRYYNLSDAQWAQSVLLEFTFTIVDPQPEDWIDGVYQSEFDELITLGLEDIEVNIIEDLEE